MTRNETNILVVRELRKALMSYRGTDAIDPASRAHMSQLYGRRTHSSPMLVLGTGRDEGCSIELVASVKYER